MLHTRRLTCRLPRHSFSTLQQSLGPHPKKLNDNIAVWSEMKDLMVKYKCLSLGEGAPNLMPP